jgi:hypothetical protein
MIAELLLIVDLLNKSSLRSTPTISQPDIKTPTPKRPRGLGLFDLGKIETITQPVPIDPSKIDFAKLDWIPRKGF